MDANLYVKGAVHFIGMSFCMLSFAADIYRSDNLDGTYNFASQKNDASYSLYSKDENSPTSSKIFGQPSQKISSKGQVSLEPLIGKYAEKHNVDVNLIRAIVAIESKFNVFAVSPKGAIGVMQLMPATAARYGVKNPTDPAQNIEAGVRYIKDLLILHKGNVALALASYNAGEGSVIKHGRRIPPYKETMLYVPAVMTKMAESQNRLNP